MERNADMILASGENALIRLTVVVIVLESRMIMMLR